MAPNQINGTLILLIILQIQLVQQIWKTWLITSQHQITFKITLKVSKIQTHSQIKSGELSGVSLELGHH